MHVAIQRWMHRIETKLCSSDHYGDSKLKCQSVMNHYTASVDYISL